MIQSNWHAKNTLEVLSTLGSSSTDGLKADEAERRLKINGYNELELFERPSTIMRFLRQFHNILIYALLISAIITAYLGYMVDTGVILGVVVLNAIFGFIQEGKAEKAIEAIREMLAPNAQVIRNGSHASIPAKSLVPGDVVLIKSGDKIPADLRLLNTKNLQIQEAILTGESNAVEKNINTVLADASLGDRLNMAYSGTIVTYGRGTGVVVATGSNTEIGKIGSLLKTVQNLTTPLIQQMNTFGRWLTLAIAVFATITFLIGVFVWHDSFEHMFMAAVGLAVAAIPEGLPPILTIILAIGVTRMAKRNAIIRRLPAVETMGAVTTICTDKTGTLTRNEQTIKSIVTSNNCYAVEENGIVALSLNNKSIELKNHKDLLEAINISILCNDAEFSQNHNGQWHIHGNAVDKALLELGGKVKIDLRHLQQEYPRIDLIPYESEHKFMATLHHGHQTQHGCIYIKGAPERILEMCSLDALKNQDLYKNYWKKKIGDFAHQGYRVIAIATKKVSDDKQTLIFDDIANDLTLVAVFGLIDAPRTEAAAAVSQCHSAGIKVKMITGDHAETAATIAALVGINTKTGVLTGSEIDNMSDKDLAEVVSDINVFARTSPHHKLRLVQALQTNGELVAMTGDGVNDAPALRRADIGVAMGKRGAEIAKEASAMVLADDNFATIVHAIEEGRTIYDNIKKVLLLILPTNVAEALTIVMAIIFGSILPITPVQILWINMITAVTLAIALGFEPAESDVMQRLPRKANTSILSSFLIWRTVFVSALLVSSVFGLFMLERLVGVDLPTARTVAVNMLVLGEVVYLMNCRKLHSQTWNIKTIFGSKPILLAMGIVILAQLFFTYLPIMQHFFGTTNISLLQWVYIIILSMGIYIFVEIEKLISRRVRMKVGNQ